MNDPLYDPRFPDRPQHPDFWRLAEAGMQLDGRTKDDGQTTSQAMDGLVDPDSLHYICESRTNLMLDGVGAGHLPTPIRLIVQAAMLAGVVHGIAFERAGGHRE